VSLRVVPRLPLAAWAGLLCGGAVLATTGTSLLVLRLGSGPWAALAAGTAAGMLMSLGAVAAGARFGAALRRLGARAVLRPRDASVPVDPQDAGAPGPAELAELAKVLDALQLRVRVADELGERHRREAQTAGAGVVELLSGLVSAEEGARGQLAAELHDTVAQSLMIARGLLADRPSSPEELARLSDHVEDAEEQVRAVMSRSRPPALREGDLASAVSALSADMQARYGLRVSVQWPAAPHPLPLAGAITVYRFFQEALLNVVKHADVDAAALSLQVEQECVLAVVRDEGPGFDPTLVRADRGRHVGLGLLRERARLSGGGLEVVSAPGTGTTLRLRLPRPPRSDSAGTGSSRGLPLHASC
jgi:signal transduction histidine kinase